MCRHARTAGTRASAPRSVRLASAAFPTRSSTCPGASSQSPWKVTSPQDAAGSRGQALRSVGTVSGKLGSEGGSPQ